MIRTILTVAIFGVLSWQIFATNQRIAELEQSPVFAWMNAESEMILGMNLPVAVPVRKPR